jgi:tetratricopeptide (TPR) repeat protein
VAANPYFDRANTFRDNGDSDSAFVYFNKAKEVFIQEKDSLGVATCLANMGVIATNSGDYFGGLEISLNALSYFDKLNRNQYGYIRFNYGNLGLAAENLKNYPDAIHFYEQALSYKPDSTAVFIIKNNIANVYRDSGKYKAAIQLYNEILKQGVSGIQYARVISNLAATRWLMNPNYNAAIQYKQALAIRLREKDLWGQNSSYAHLADYYMKRQPDSALLYSHKMYRVAQQIQSPDDELAALQKLIRLSPVDQSRRYFERYEQKGDSLQSVRNAAKNQFALIRYEAEKHKAEYLKSRAENVQKQNTILRISILVAALATSLLVGYFYYLRRKKQLKMEKEIEVKNTTLKYVKKVHDRVANGVYQVMSELEYADQVDVDELLDKLDVLYQASRDISYEDRRPATAEIFEQELMSMLAVFSHEQLKLDVQGHEKSIWKGLESATTSEIYLVLQELMVNMKKHSKATHVVLSFSRQGNKVHIHYWDNGIGLAPDLRFNNGLSNMANRMKNIKGNISFDHGVDSGAGVHISFSTT